MTYFFIFDRQTILISITLSMNLRLWFSYSIFKPHNYCNISSGSLSCTFVLKSFAYKIVIIISNNILTNTNFGHELFIYIFLLNTQLTPTKENFVVNLLPILPHTTCSLLSQRQYSSLIFKFYFSWSLI